MKSIPVSRCRANKNTVFPVISGNTGYRRDSYGFCPDQAWGRTGHPARRLCGRRGGGAAFPAPGQRKGITPLLLSFLPAYRAGLILPEGGYRASGALRARRAKGRARRAFGPQKIDTVTSVLFSRKKRKKPDKNTINPEISSFFPFVSLLSFVFLTFYRQKQSKKAPIRWAPFLFASLHAGTLRQRNAESVSSRIIFA